MKITNVKSNKTNGWLITMPVERGDLSDIEAERAYTRIQREEHDSETIDPQIKSQDEYGKCYDFNVCDELTQFHEDNDEPITAYVVALTDNQAQHDTAEPNEDTREAYNEVKCMDRNPYFGKWKEGDDQVLDISYLELDHDEARRVARQREQTVFLEIENNPDLPCPLTWHEIKTKREATLQA